jgi:acetylornithine/N-succinyldiaminopimelate aminotransferase
MNKATVINPPFPKQYGDELLVFTHGEGCRLVDRSGKKYLDMGSGIAVNALGYGREDLAEIAAAQMKKLIHVSNLYATEPQLELAGKMIAAAVPGGAHAHYEAVHFGNSGTEANETALKYARLYAKTRRGEGHHRFVAFSNGFHGRTMGALSVTSNPSYREPFGPLVPGVEFLPLNDTEALKKALNDTVCAVIVEPLQGEGGLNLVDRPFAETLNSLCRAHDIMLIADEVQTGLGRCGALFASGITGLEPDMITLAKPLAGGLPLSAVLVPSGINKLLKPGHHATTFGGGPVTTAVASAVWDILADPAFLAEVRRKGELLEALLLEGLAGLGVSGEVRGAGLLRGLRMTDAGYDGKWCGTIISEAREGGLLILKTGSDVLRMAPPLLIADQEIREGVSLLMNIIKRNL